MNIRKIFITVIILLGFAIPVFPETYYVDFTNSETTSADSNAGTSTATALIHCPGDNNYSPSGPAPTSLSAGDTVIFKGGIIYDGSVDVDWNGSDGSPITYDGNSAETWGTGKAIMDTDNDGTQ